MNDNNSRSIPTTPATGSTEPLAPLPPNMQGLVRCPGLDDIDDYEFADAPDLTLDTAARMQDSNYSASDKAAPDNNLFFAERSNPLSSKGD